MTDTELKAMFEKETAKVEIQTSIYADETMIYELPVKSAKVVSGSTANSRKFKYTLNGLRQPQRIFSTTETTLPTMALTRTRK